MSNSKDAPGSSAESSPEAQSTIQGGRPDEADRPQEGWFDRLRAAVGLRSSSVRQEIEEAIEEDTAENGFSQEERALLANILRLRDYRVADIMIPRADVYAIEIDATLGELMAEFKDSGHSRMPVYRESLDDPLGMVHVRDLLNYIASQTIGDGNGDAVPTEIASLDLSKTIAEAGVMRDVLFVPPSMPVASLLTLMQTRHVQMALVIDEFGGTDGLVSIEDAVETIVGEIEDEHDEEEHEIVADDRGAFIADAGASVEDVARFVGGDLDKNRDEDGVDTIGGLVFNHLGRIPAEGEVVTIPGYEVVIIEADQRRVRKVKIRRLAAQEPAPTDDMVSSPVARAATGT
ncbi:MAG: hemolysin family protein [Bauldia sp.]